MTRPTVLIAALSGRALAQSARRAGFEPLVADAFGDLDTVATAAAYVGLPDAVRTGFRAAPLIAALERLTSATATDPVGLVLGSGFEDKPRLMAALAERFCLLGCGHQSVAQAKDPELLFALLDGLQIAHPETRLEAPKDLEGWLIKKTGASGGAHIHSAIVTQASRGVGPGLLRDDGKVSDARKRHYYQRRIEGAPVSVLVIAARDGMNVIGYSRQWTAGQGVRPFRYGGAVGPVQFATAVEDQMRRAADSLVRTLDLVGLVSFDFVERDGVPYLVDINPRPGATLDVFDDEQGSLFAHHIEVSSSALLLRGESERGTGTGGRVAAQQRMSGAANGAAVRAAAILYADNGPVEVGQVTWSEWAADQTAPGTRVPAERPIATVHGSGPTPDAALQQCRARLDALEDLIYRTANNEKTRRNRPNASHDRTDAEHFQARRAHR